MLVCDHIIMFPQYYKGYYRTFFAYVSMQGKHETTNAHNVLPGNTSKCTINYWDTRIRNNLKMMRLAIQRKEDRRDGKEKITG